MRVIPQSMHKVYTYRDCNLLRNIHARTQIMFAKYLGQFRPPITCDVKRQMGSNRTFRINSRCVRGEVHNDTNVYFRWQLFGLKCHIRSRVRVTQSSLMLVLWNQRFHTPKIYAAEIRICGGLEFQIVQTAQLQVISAMFIAGVRGLFVSHEYIFARKIARRPA